MNPYTLSIIGFVAVLAVLLWRDRDKIEVSNYVLFIRRTARGRGLISKIATKNKKFWNYLGTFSTVVGFGAMGFGFYYLANIFADQLITGAPAAAGPKFVLPVPSQDAAFLPGVLGVPFWSWVISVGLLMLVHEGMHGVMIKTIGSGIKSLGVLLLLVIPGAFVEPDEEDLGQKKWTDQLKVYSVGSFANFCLGFFVFLLMSFAFVPAFMSPAVGFQGYVNAAEYNVSTFPAQKVNMTGPIVSIDGNRTENLGDLSRVLQGKNPGEEITVRTSGGSYRLELAEHPRNETRPFLGISRPGNTYTVKERYVESGLSPTVDYIFELLNWIFLLNVGIGIMNLLPLKPLDGGLMVEAVSQHHFPEKSREIVRISSSITLALLFSIFLMIFL